MSDSEHQRVAIELQAAKIEKESLERIAFAAFWRGDVPKINKARADVMNATELWLDALQAASKLGIVPTA